MHGRMESPNISSQANVLNPSCLRQTQSSRRGTNPGYENTEPGCTLTVLRVPSVIYPLRSADDKSGKVV